MISSQLILWLLRLGLISAFVWLAGWIAVYTRFARWWRNPIGRTLVAKTALLAVLLVPSTLNLFFELNRATSVFVAWLDVTLVWLITPVMVWRTVVWVRLHRAGLLDGKREPTPPPPGEGDP